MSKIPFSTRSISLAAPTVLLTTPCMAASAATDQNGSIALQIGIVFFVVIIVVGVILGLTRRAVVFRNYDDLALVFGCAVTGFVAVASANAPLVSTLFALVCAGLFLSIVTRTWRDNGLLLLPIVLPTKLVLSFLWIQSIVTSIAPNGRTMVERAQSRSTAFLILAILTPLMLRLVRDHEGFLSARHS